MKEFKYKISLATKIVPIDTDKQKKIVLLASKNDNIAKLLPKEINITDNVGFVPFSAEAFVSNKLNLNADGVKTEEAIKLKNGFPFCYIDANHDRTHIIGVIVDSAYTDYKTGKELSEADVKGMTEPFAVSISGIIWKAPNPDLAEEIENLNSKNSDYKDSLFLSWEIGFDKADLIVMKRDSFDFADGKLITDPAEIEQLSERLVINGGDGYTEKGLKIGRVPIDDVVGLGVGIVLNPAGQVSPIVVDKNQSKAEVINEEMLKAIKNIIIETIKDNSLLQNSENKISQANELVVNQDIDKIVLNKDITMKIEKFEQLTDENLKDVKIADLKEIFASSTKDLVDSKIKDISKDYVSKLEEKDVAIKASQDSIVKLNESVTELTNKLSKASEDLTKIQEENKQREQLEALANRMALIEENFDLDDKQKEIVASKVKTCSTDDDFKNYLAEIEILLAAKKKNKNSKQDTKDNKKDDGKDDDNEDDEDDKDDKKDDSKKTSKASVDTTVIDETLKNGKKDETVIPNAAATTESIAERAKKAFGLDGWKVTNKRANRI